jgi:TfoX/Sxy family transcriptional regulator of competence genes
VAYDEALADRVRSLLADSEVDAVAEQRMFGGLAFLVGGNMAVAVSGSATGGGLMVRVAKEETERWLDEPFATPMVMRGRPMAGWLRVDAAGLQDAQPLEAWVRRGADYARSLPRKDRARR